jgi:hypothetical protein
MTNGVFGSTRIAALDRIGMVSSQPNQLWVNGLWMHAEILKTVPAKRKDDMILPDYV